ncbi:hypothetical protein HOD29_02440, partial [archaeon]|nr:hypothetical protein [archaeon]
FDYESYFVFKHWPFKIFNVNWKKKWTLLKYPVIVIVIGLIIAGFMFNSAVIRGESSIIETTTSIQNQMNQLFFDDCLDNILVTYNLSVEESLFISILKNEEEYFYDSASFLDIDTILYGCNLNSYTCIEKDFEPNQKVEEQLVLEENFNLVAKVLTNEMIYIVILNEDISNEELISCSNFNIDERELQFKVVQEFINEKRKLFLDIFEKTIPEVTWFNFIDLKKQSILDNIELGFQLDIFRAQEEAIYHELGPVDNLNKRIMIYDNSSTFSEHIDKLNDNINILYPKYLASEPKSNMGFGGLLSNGDYSPWAIFSFEASTDYLVVGLLVSEEWVENFTELMNHKEDVIKRLYQSKDIEESLESKAIRLKIIETLLAKKIVSDDGGQEEEISAITKTPELLK